MWKNPPAWIVILRDITATVIGLGGAALLILRGNPDPVVLVILFTLAGAPGAANLSALLTGATRQNSPSGTEPPSSSSPQSESQSS